MFDPFAYFFIEFKSKHAFWFWFILIIMIATVVLAIIIIIGFLIFIIIIIAKSIKEQVQKNKYKPGSKALEELERHKNIQIQEYEFLDKINPQKSKYDLQREDITSKIKKSPEGEIKERLKIDLDHIDVKMAKLETQDENYRKKLKKQKFDYRKADLYHKVKDMHSDDISEKRSTIKNDTSAYESEKTYIKLVIKSYKKKVETEKNDKLKKTYRNLIKKQENDINRIDAEISKNVVALGKLKT